MNIKKAINANYVNMVISKQKKKNVFIVARKKMVALDVINVDMKLMKLELKQIKLYVKNVIHKTIINIVMMKVIILIIF